MLKTQELEEGFAPPRTSYQGSVLDQLGTLRSPDTLPNFVPLTSNPGSAPFGIDCSKMKAQYTRNANAYFTVDLKFT